MAVSPLAALARGLLGHQNAALGVVPCGSGNDLARNLDIVVLPAPKLIGQGSAPHQQHQGAHQGQHPSGHLAPLAVGLQRLPPRG